MPTVLVSGAGFIGSYTCKASLSASSWASTEWLSSSASARATAIQRPRSCERAYCCRRERGSKQPAGVAP